MLRDLLAKASFDLADISRLLDTLEGAALVRETHALGAREQRTLFDAAKGFRPLRFDDLVPAATPQDTLIRHAGKNTLPAFSSFEKRFGRPAASPEALWGHNQQTFTWLTGPGYFVASEREGEIVLDGTIVPPLTPSGWPKVVPNTGFHGLVFGGVVDTLRGVSSRVCIGRALKHGKETNHFVLVRSEKGL